MGYMSHHTIVVTSVFEDKLAAAHAKAVEIFSETRPDDPFAASAIPVSPIMAAPTNGYASFFIGPDGSKEGWDASDWGDQCRAKFKAWLNSEAYEDGSNGLEWVEVNFGGDGALDGREDIIDSAARFYDEDEPL